MRGNSIRTWNITGARFLVGPDLVKTNYHVMEHVISGAVAPAWCVRVRFDCKATPNKTVNDGSRYRLAAEWLLDKSEVGPQDEPTAKQLDYAIKRQKNSRPVGRQQAKFFQILIAPEAFTDTEITLQ